jgi:hypothetical protein
MISYSVFRSLVNNRHMRITEDIHTASFIFFLSFLMGWDSVHLVRRPLIGLLYQPRMIDDECAAVGGMRIGRGNRNTRRKPAPNIENTCEKTPAPVPVHLTWSHLQLNPSLCSEKPASNPLSYGNIIIIIIIRVVSIIGHWLLSSARK